MTKFVIVKKNIHNNDMRSIIVCADREGANVVCEKMNLHAMNTKDYVYYVREVIENDRQQVIDHV